MAAKGRASQVNVQRSIAELEASWRSAPPTRPASDIHDLSESFAAIDSGR